MACMFCMEEPEEGKCIAGGCRTCCNCGRKLPSFDIPTTVVVSKESGEKIAKLLEEPPDSTPAMLKLFKPDTKELKEDIKFLLTLVPQWSRESKPGLGPSMYGTGTHEGDQAVIARVNKIIEKL